jgi:hypothetical protein
MDTKEVDTLAKGVGLLLIFKVVITVVIVFGVFYFLSKYLKTKK